MTNYASFGALKTISTVQDKPASLTWVRLDTKTYPRVFRIQLHCTDHAKDLAEVPQQPRRTRLRSRTDGGSVANEGEPLAGMKKTISNLYSCSNTQTLSRSMSDADGNPITLRELCDRIPRACDMEPLNSL